MYRILNQRGFEHYTVCHRDHYVATDGTHTNYIEGVWSHVKQNLKEKWGVSNHKLPAHVDEFLYRWNRKSEGQIFSLLMSIKIIPCLVISVKCVNFVPFVWIVFVTCDKSLEFVQSCRISG